MLGDYLRPVAQAVSFEIFAHAEHVRLVHSYMHVARGKALRKRLEHVVYQSIGPLVAHEYYIVYILYLAVFGVTEYSPEVRESLNAGYEFYAAPRGVSVHALKLLCGVSAPQISEIRLALNLVGVFGVKPDCVVTEFAQYVRHALESLCGDYRVSRTVNHYPEFIECDFFHFNMLL